MGYDFKKQRILKKICGRKSGQAMAGPPTTALACPASGHHRPLTGTELYCLVTGTCVCEQLAQGCYLKAERPRFEPLELLSRKSNALTTMPPSHVFCCLANDIAANVVTCCRKQTVLTCWMQQRGSGKTAVIHGSASRQEQSPYLL